MDTVPACFVSFGALYAALTKTDWYEGGQLPARSGVYEIEPLPLTQRDTFRYFDGERWYFGSDNPDRALYYFQSLGIVLTDGRRWRGLTEQAK